MLTEKAREMLLKYRKFLEQDNLGEFYNRIYNEGLMDSDQYSISEFLDDSGIKFEEYMDFIPFDFMYAPKHWIENDATGMGTIMCIPENIKTIGSNGFFDTEIDACYADHVVSIGKYAFSSSDIKFIRLGSALTNVDMASFEHAQNLNYIAVDKNAAPKAIDILRSFEAVCHQRGPNDVYPNVTVELY